MPRVHLNQKIVNRLQAPDPSGKPKLHWDDDLTGFGVCCSGKKHTKTYIVQRDINGRSRRVPVGATNEFTFPQARQRAIELLQMMRGGVDPKRKVVVPTLQWALERYLEARSDLRPKSVRNYRQVERTLKPWMNMPLSDISGDMVERRHKELVMIVSRQAAQPRYDGRATANFAMKTLGILWNHAAARHPGLPPNPTERLKRRWFKDQRRTGMVKAEQLPTFYAAVQQLENPIARDLIKLLLFTGLRVGEATSLRWTDVDLPERMIRLPASSTKANRAFNLPMSTFVYDLLVARRGIGNATYVFPGRAAGSHVSTNVRAMGVIAQATGIKVSPHDLRRTYATVADETEILRSALKKMLNHAGTDVTSGYVDVSPAALRAAVQKVADRLQALCGAEPAGGANVIKLP